MKRSYREVLYSSYHSTQSLALHGVPTLVKMEQEFPALEAYFEDLLPRSKDARILDIGCGNGNFIYFLHSRGYHMSHGVDVSKEQIEVGRELGIKNLSVGNAMGVLGIKSEEHDVIVARDVLEHCTKEEAFELLTLIAASLKPGGRFIMQVPNGEGLHAPSIQYGDYTHETVFTASSARQVLLNTGFARVTHYPVEPLRVGFRGRARHCLWRLRVAQHRLWKRIETGNGSGIFTATIVVVGEK